MKLIKAGIIFNSGDALENVLCKVDYDKNVIYLYSEAGDRTGLIPLSSMMKLEFKGYYDTEQGDIDSSVDEGW